MPFPAFLRRLWPHHRLLLAALWALAQAYWLWKFRGPHFVNDSARYLLYAQDIAGRGYFEPGHNRRYILYPLFQSFWLWLGTGRWGIVAGQVALSGLATRALYGATRRLVGGGWPPLKNRPLTTPPIHQSTNPTTRQSAEAAAAGATALFVLWPDIQQFNAYLLTESVFSSLSVLSFAALLRLRARPTAGRWAALLAGLALAALARPNGFVVALAAAAAGLAALAQQPRRQRRRAGLALALLAVLLAPLAWQLLNYQLETFYLMDTYQRGELVFRSPLWAVRPAGAFVLPPPGTGPVARVLYFAAHNPGFFIRLMLGKLWVFASGLKPHYSLAHRALNVAVLWPAYWLAARAATRPGLWRPGRVFLAALPLLQAAVVMLTVDDWDVRFVAPVLFAVFVLAASGLARRWGGGMIKGGHRGGN